MSVLIERTGNADFVDATHHGKSCKSRKEVEIVLSALTEPDLRLQIDLCLARNIILEAVLVKAVSLRPILLQEWREVAISRWRSRRLEHGHI